MPATPAPELHLLGSPQVVLGASAEPQLMLERKTAALLALLALEGPKPRARLAALLWPEASLAQARNSLRQRIFRLQRASGFELVTGGDDLQLDARVRIDIAAASAQLAADPQACGGELLGDLDYADCALLAEWVDAARERWRRQRATLVAGFASDHEAKHEIARALDHAQRLLADEPLQEHAHRRVMRLHYLRGDRAAALAAFERCRDLLRIELGTAPDRETAALAKQIAAGDTPATRPAAPLVTVLRPPRLIAREAQRAALDDAVVNRRIAWLSGEPGIGKSRLLDDLARAHPSLLASAAHAGESTVPYALLARLAGVAQQRFPTSFTANSLSSAETWAEARVEGAGRAASRAMEAWVIAELARLLPALGAAPAARLDPLRLQQAVCAAADAWATLGLVGFIVDDLHHADDASIECLLALADAPRAQPLAWIFGVRSQEVPPAAAAWLATADHGAVQRIAVPALDAAAVEALLASLALPGFEPRAWAAPLLVHSRGNPLFALETLRALLAIGDAAGREGQAASSPATLQPARAVQAVPPRLPVPAALGALIERRLSRLSEAALRLVRIAALAGADFDADLAAQVLEQHPLDMVAPWRELETAEILHGGRFTHDLIAETTAGALPEAIAQALHARLATALEALGRSAARVAPHWARAQSWGRAGEVYAAAAREAQRASRRADEVVLWEQAADGFDRAGQAGKAFDARSDGLESLIVVRGTPAAMQLVDRLAEDAMTEPQRMRALTARATACLFAGDQAGGEAAARAALDAATSLGALWPRFEAARLLAVALSQAFRASEALAIIEPFREVVEAEGNAEQQHHFWADYAYALKAAQRLRDCANALRRAMASAEAAGDHAELATLTSNLAVVVSNFGAPQESLDHGKRARALRDPLGQIGGPGSGAIDLYIAVANVALGRYTEALADFDRAEACFTGDGRSIWLPLTANYRAMLFMHLGQFARAKQLLDQGGAPPLGVAARRAMLRARVERALGGNGRTSLEEALAIVGPQGDHLVRMLTRLDATFGMEPADAAAMCAALRDEAEAVEHSAVAMRARVLRIEHWRRGGMLGTTRHRSPHDTMRELDAVAAALDSVHPADTYLPDAWWALAQAYDSCTATDAAEACLARGHEWITRRALPNVPGPFRESFLHRNASNRDLLAAAARRLGLRVPAAAG